MTIFKKQKPTNEGGAKKVVGSYLPHLLIEYITLYAMDLKISKASVIENQIREFKFRKEQNGIDLNYLINSLAKTAIDEYKKSEITRLDFLNELEAELYKKNISSKIINTIMVKVSDETKD